MNEDKITGSAAMLVLKHMWVGTTNVKPFSDLRVRHSMHDTLRTLILAGVAFGIEDVKNLYDNFHLGRGYYAEGYLTADEYDYATAITVNNISFCISFEFACSRKPFIANSVQPIYAHYAGHHDITKSRCRLGVGSKFVWKGEYVTVTSFSKDSSYLTACSYHPHDPGKKSWEQNRKPLHVFKITHKDLKKPKAVATTPEGDKGRE